MIIKIYFQYFSASFEISFSDKDLSIALAKISITSRASVKFVVSFIEIPILLSL